MDDCKLQKAGNATKFKLGDGWQGPGHDEGRVWGLPSFFFFSWKEGRLKLWYLSQQDTEGHHEIEVSDLRRESESRHELYIAFENKLKTQTALQIDYKKK